MIQDYIMSLPSRIIGGDYFAIMVSLIPGYFILLVLHKISGWTLIVIKKTIAFIITGLGLLMIYNNFMESLQAEGISFKTYLIGVAGIVIGVLGIFISFYSLFRHTKKGLSGKEKSQPEQPQVQTAKVSVESPEKQKGAKDSESFLSMDSLKNDKSLLSVLTFLIVAQFGIFSSKTVSAPNPKIGLLMFGIFLFFSFIFIKQSYARYTRGLSHLVITFLTGTALAMVLGHYWANIPLDVLFSMKVFETDVLVALISGMALSLFAGSRS